LGLNQCASQICGPFQPTFGYNGPLSGFPGTATVGTGSFVKASGFLPILANEVPTSGANADNAATLIYYFEVVPVGGGSTVAPVQIGVKGTGTASVGIISSFTAGTSANILAQLTLASGESGGAVFSDTANIVYNTLGDNSGCSTANTSSATGAGFVSTPGVGGATISCTSSSMSGGFTESGSYTIDTNSPYLITMQAIVRVGCDNNGLAQGPGSNQATVSVTRPTISVPAGYTLLFGPGIGSSPPSGIVAPNGNATVAGDDNSGLTQNSASSMEAQTVIDPDQFPTGPIFVTGLAQRAAPGLGALNATFGQSVYLSTSPNWANPTGHPLLSTTFANNVGPDNTLVYTGSTNVEGAACAAPGPCPFANSIPFTTPFLYNPGKGPLLIDQEITSLDLTSGQMDVKDCDPASCSVAGIAAVPLGTATASQVNASGTILQFTYVTAACSITGNITITVLDAQAVINQALGAAPPANDVNGDGLINVADVQTVLTAVLTLACPVNSTTTDSLSVSLNPITTPAPRSGGSQGAVSAAVAVTAPPPVIRAVANAASLQNGPVSRGEIVMITGTGLGPSIPAGLTLDQPRKAVTSLAGVQVLFDGAPALLAFVSATQIKCVVPRAAQGTSYVQVRYQDRASNLFPLGAIATNPALFTADGSGSGSVAALNQDESANSPSHPAARGSTVILFMTGEGRTSPRDLLPAQVRIGGQRASVAFYGEAPGVVPAVMQLNVQIPLNVPSGDLPVSVSIGGNSTQDGVTVSVR
jgi:uncharacterized protein (TIGR03437 family)